MIDQKLQSNLSNHGEEDQCWEYQGYLDEWGYGSIKREGKTHRAHRYVYSKLTGEDITDKVLRHTCDNPACCNPKHLIPGTHDDNVQDRVEKGRSAVGVDNGRTKLTEEIVLDIRAGKYDTMSNPQVARLFGVDPKSIYQIRKNLTWKYLL